MNAPGRYGPAHDASRCSQVRMIFGKLYECPTCDRVGRAPLRPKCCGSANDENDQHPPVMTKVVPERFADRVNPNDPPLYR